MKKKTKKILNVLLIVLIVIFIVAPIIVKKIIDLRRELSTSIGYRYVLEIEKRNLIGENRIDDGVNIDVKKLKIIVDKTASIYGTVTIEKGFVRSANLKINGYTFKYTNLDVPFIENEYKYYINNSQKYDEVNHLWKIYIRENVINNSKYKNAEHTLIYKYKNKKYSFILDNQKECDLCLKKLSKLSDYKDISCRLTYENAYKKKELCIVINKHKTLCYDSNSWGRINDIKSELKKYLKDDIKCNLTEKKLYCKTFDDYGWAITIKKSGYVSISDFNKKNKCFVENNKIAKCS